MATVPFSMVLLRENYANREDNCACLCEGTPEAVSSMGLGGCFDGRTPSRNDTILVPAGGHGMEANIKGYRIAKWDRCPEYIARIGAAKR